MTIAIIYTPQPYLVPGFEDLYLGVGAQLFYGSKQDEFGFFKHLYYTELKLYL